MGFYLSIINHAANVTIHRLNRIQLLHGDLVPPSIMHGTIDLIKQAGKRDIALILIEQQVVAIAPVLPSAVERALAWPRLERGGGMW